MNKLEKQLKDIAGDWNNAPIEYNGDEVFPWKRGFDDGVDATLALELPVKFAEWQLGEEIDVSMMITLCKDDEVVEVFDNMKGLYQYWIENIYKI